MDVARLIKIYVPVAIIACCGLYLLWYCWPAPTAGRGKPAEIIHPQTGQRIPTTWDRIFAKSSEKPPRTGYDPGPTGGWYTQLPDSKLWGWVVNPGQTKEGPPPQIEPSVEAPTKTADAAPAP